MNLKFHTNWDLVLYTMSLKNYQSNHKIMSFAYESMKSYYFPLIVI